MGNEGKKGEEWAIRRVLKRGEEKIREERQNKERTQERRGKIRRRLRRGGKREKRVE